VRRWTLRLVIAMAMLVVASSSVAGASGDRSIVGEGKLTAKPFKSIVLVSVGSRVVCTGFVVGARKVATAAHCLTRDPANGDYRFRAGLPGSIRLYRAYSAAAGGATFPACGVSKAWAHPKFIRSGSGDRRAGSRSHDYAVLTTPANCTFPKSARMKVWPTTLGGGELQGGDAVKLAGYPSDSRFEGMNGANLWRSNGKLVPNGGDPGMLYFSGFVAQGMSGGPVWRTFNKNSPCGRKHCVVGVATECSVNGNGLCRLGDSTRRAVRISPSVKRAFNNR
jgi:V8-like Glu-specific endopeptidase